MQSKNKCSINEKCKAIIESAFELALEQSTNGFSIVSYENIRLHSGVDPMKESELLLQSIIPVLDKKVTESVDSVLTCYVIGAGLGYILKPLSDYLSKKYCKYNIVAVEIIPEVSKAALTAQVWKNENLPIEWIVSQDVLTNRLTETQQKFVCIVANSASYRLNKPIYDRIICPQKFSADNRPMRILVPTPLYGGSYPIALHCADAFRELGHHVELLDFGPYYSAFLSFEKISRRKEHSKLLQNMFASLLGEVIVAKAIDFNADLVWAVAQTPMTPTSLQELKTQNIQTALWFVEDYNLFNYWKETAQFYDAVFTIQKIGFLDQLNDMGVKHCHYLPLAANPKVHCQVNLTAVDKIFYGSEVSFVGAGYYNRQKTFEKLQIDHLKIWGCDWQKHGLLQQSLQKNSERVTTEETVKIYNATKVNLNLHSSPNHKGVNPNGDFVNPRTFEIAACGGFQLVDERSELSELFKINEEIVTFSNTHDIPKLIEYYTQHESEMRVIAEKARQRVLQDHTYVHRMVEALAVLQKNTGLSRNPKSNDNTIAAMKESVKHDLELTEFLAKFDDHEEVNLDKIVSSIKLGSGKLTKAEGIFLLMKEFRDWGVEKGVIA